MNSMRQEFTVGIRIPSALALCAIAFLVGCSTGPQQGEVSGTVTVDGKPPSAGSSITFIPTGGQSPTAGAVIENGKYSAMVPVGMSRVEIRVPRPVRAAANSAPKQGPGAAGPGGGGIIEESLPAKYNDNSELTFEVKAGQNPKDWSLEAAP